MSRNEEVFQEIVRRIQGGDTEVGQAMAEELGKLTAPKRSGTGRYGSGTGWYVVRVELVSGQAHGARSPGER